MTEYKAVWKLGGDSYTIVTRRNSETKKQQTFIYKNKEKMNIELIDGECGSFVFDIPVDVFVKIFDLEYEIDQENGAVYFTSE